VGEEIETRQQPIKITYGYSRDRRPDLKQFMIDLIVSGDGDVWQGDKRARKFANKGFWLLSLEIDLAILGKKLTKELGIGASLLGIIINKWEMARRTFSS
jgi:hypothetical protein